jgi:hypothetical protein
VETFGGSVKLESALNKQISGNHYRKHGDYQPWQVLASWLTPEELRGFGKGTAIAYLARERDKGGDDDIRKAIHTLQLYLELAEKERSACKDAS